MVFSLSLAATSNGRLAFSIKTSVGALVVGTEKCFSGFGWAVAGGLTLRLAGSGSGITRLTPQAGQLIDVPDIVDSASSCCRQFAQVKMMSMAFQPPAWLSRLKLKLRKPKSS
jgi:hypothetical protein